MSEETVVQEAEQVPAQTQVIEAPKATKVQQKRQQIFMDRLRRKMAAGMTEEQAARSIAQEDYDAMPLDKKFSRFQATVSAAINNLARDLMELRHNDQVIADSFDINYRVLEKIFSKLGVTDEEKRAFLAEAQKEYDEAKKKKHEAQMEARRKAMEDAEKAKVETEVKAAEAKQVTPVEAEGSDPDARAAEGATVFGEG